MKPRRFLLATALGAGLLSGPVRAEDTPAVPAYAAPAEAPALPKPLDDAVARAVRTLLATPSPDTAEAEVRRLSGIGPGALPRVAAALRDAPWRSRAALVSAVAEMDAPGATPLLEAASRDPSFAVREAAVAGLGKTGTSAGAAAILARAAAPDEPSWRVRAAAATAIRRGILRGTVDRGPGGAALATLLGDPDPDVARAAAAASAPLALPETLPALLARFADLEAAAADRAVALAALRAYRDPSPDLVAALRRGFLGSSDADLAVRAARALLDVRGFAALADPEVEAAVLLHLTDEAARDMREALVALGPEVRPWLVERARAAAHRVAAAREEPGESPFEPLLDAVFQADEAAGIDLVREILGGPEAEALHAETRRVALRKAQFGFATKMRTELRALLRSPAGQDLYAEALRAVAASGGDDVAGLVEEALGSPRADVRAAGLDVLDRFRNVAAPEALAKIAESSGRPREQARALAILGRRDRARAAKIAEPLVVSPDPALRDAAIGELGNSRDPGVADLLRRRLREEDGRSSSSAATGSAPVPAAETQSDAAETAARVRRTLRSALVRALHRVAGPAAKPDLLRAALGDADAKVRETAAQELHGLVSPADAAAIAARIGAEPDDTARDELERLLATLGDAPEAAAHFARRVADGSQRTPALRLLAEPRSRVVPPGLAAGLADPAWNDDERVSALRILERSGRTPGVPDLSKLASDARTLDLCAEAVRALAADVSPAAAGELAKLLTESADPARRSLAARGIGERRAAALAPLLVRQLDACRARATAAESRAAADVQLYRECAIALGRIASDDAVAALVAHLLHPDLASAGARRSVHSNGPFQPEEGAVVTLIRTLVAAVAHADDASLARRLDTEVALRSADGSQWILDEAYLDGVARYLADPMAYDLPARRRTAAALPLRLLAARTPPRWSPLDADAWKSAAGELETQGRFAEAREAFAAGVASSDVEDAARSREDRLWEGAKLVALRAREAQSAGRADEALALAATIRAPDPSNGDLAYLHGWCLVKLGRAGPEAADSLRAALARDARDANAQFFLAWIAESADGPEKSVPLWEEAMRNDARRIQDFSPTDLLATRRGRPHRWGHFPYWLARALAAAGRDDDASAALGAAIRLDDRFGAQALSDAAFDRFSDRAAFVAGVVSSLPDEPTGVSGDAAYPQAP